MNRQFLIICRAGDRSLHQHWIAQPNRNFDLFISYFGDTPDQHKKDADYYEQVKGPKWPIIHQILQNNPQFLTTYSAFWFPDDDLLMDTETINQMFNLFAGLKLKLAQPALTPDSYVAHKELVQSPDSLFRLVNFIEVMAPLFAQDALTQLKETLGQSPSGWGLDYLWPVMLAHKNMAILDATPMTHTRPLGGELYKNQALSPRNDIQALANLYPELNINKNHQPNKFRIFADVKIKLRHPKIARLAARITRKLNLKRYEQSVRYGE